MYQQYLLYKNNRTAKSNNVWWDNQLCWWAEQAELTKKMEESWKFQKKTLFKQNSENQL